MNNYSIETNNHVGGNGLLVAMLVLFVAIVANADPNDDQIQSLIERFATDTDVDTLRTELIEIGNPAIPFLIEALKNENATTRTQAVWTLGAIPKSRTQTVPIFLELLDDEDGVFRSAVVWELGQIGRPADVLATVFVERLKDDEARVRVNAVEALLLLEEKNSKLDLKSRKAQMIDVLVDAMRDEDVWPPCHAAPLLARIGSKSPAVISALVETLDHRDRLARVGAARTLVALDDGFRERVVPVVADALKAEGPWTADVAAEVLREIGTPEALRALATYDSEK